MTMDKLKQGKFGKVLLGLGAIGVAKGGLELITDNNNYASVNPPQQQEYKVTAEDSGSYPTFVGSINDVLESANSKVYAGGAETPIVDMYDWDGVCRDKNEYNSKVPSANNHTFLLEGEDFINAVNKDEDVYKTLKKHNLIKPLRGIIESETDHLDTVRITDNYLEFCINSSIEGYSNMNMKGKSRYFVFERLGETDITKLRPYFE